MSDLDIAVQAVALYESQHPRPPHVTQKQAAVMLRKSVPTVSKMIREGKIKRNKCGMIPISEVDKALTAGVAGGI